MINGLMSLNNFTHLFSYKWGYLDLLIFSLQPIF